MLTIKNLFSAATGLARRRGDAGARPGVGGSEPRPLRRRDQAFGKFIFLVAFAFLLAGCMPPGPRALLNGKKLLDRENYAEAIEQLNRATTILNTNAQAWNYLGLAYHRSGQVTNAVAAYATALRLDQNLAEARFNLGCLWLEQHQPDLAVEQFTAYTLQRDRDVEGFLKLGTAEFESRESAKAEQSFQKALKLNAQNPEALNGLGLVRLQRSRPREAAQYFSIALKHDPDYRPALLNLATVLHRYLNDPGGALQKYREYLELKPRAADWDTVNGMVQSLERQLSPEPRPATNVVAPRTATVAHPPKPPVAHAPVSTKPAPPPTKSAPLPTVAKPSPAPPSSTTVVKAPPTPIIKTIPDASPPARIEPATVSPALSAQPIVAGTPPPPKRGFFSKLNPFRHKSKPSVTPLPADASEPSPAIQSPRLASSPPTPMEPPTPYMYLSPSSPSAGDRAAAERAFAQGSQLQWANRLNEAAAAYKQAVQLDPSYFEGHYNLGLVAYQMRNYRQSLAEWEYALAIRPDATDARYNFALALKAANHPYEAAGELEKILATNPKEVRAHLVLGNLYAETLRDPAKARAQYQKVLELDPRHPQATAIRYWLVANPP